MDRYGGPWATQQIRNLLMDLGDDAADQEPEARGPASAGHQFSAFARSVTARSGDGASQLEAECALIEVSTPVESPLAGSTGESARSAGHGPVACPMDGVRAGRAALVVIPREHERVTIGCGQRLDVDIRKPSGATGRT